LLSVTSYLQDDRRVPPRHVSMTRVVKVGKLANSMGCCPVCGREVALKQSFNGVRLSECYGCYRCGPTTYVVAVA
jgi:hypothetical protein